MPDHLSLLRAELQRQNLDGLIVPHADEYQSEYLPAGAERLAWLTGFTGSAGLAIVTAEQAVLFADGRYTLQAAEQAPGFTQRHLIDNPPEEWLAQNAAGLTIGYDPWLQTPKQFEKFSTAAGKAGVTLQAISKNPIDMLWADQPKPPQGQIVPHDLAYAGESSAAKCQRLAARLVEEKVDAALVTDPTSIAWLLNVRGSDVPCTPLPLSRLILRANGAVEWFVDPAKLTQCPLSGVGVYPESAFSDALRQLGGQRVQADPAGAPLAVFEILTQAGAEIVRAADPCTLPKACKNEVELAGSRSAHVRDGIALTRFLIQLADSDPATLTELDVIDQLAACRARSNLYRGPSFETIAGAGPNGAIVHYRADRTSNRPLPDNGFLLLDSGAQYLDGTTDITRTLPLGRLTDEMRRMFTLVLKGHIALASAKFPAGTTGHQLDVLARQFLWQAGCNYDHGTGHGIGSYLSVHEGPQSISTRSGPVALQPGMILSNEPGFYQPGKYGIRIENLVTVVKAGEYLAFETLSLAPIAKEAIDVSLLSDGERTWLNQYHARVYQGLRNGLMSSEAAWLQQATAPL